MKNWLARLCAAAGALLAVTTASSAADVMKVGLIADFTGAFANWGSQFQQAVEAFQAVHGKTVKGPDGKDIEILDRKTLEIVGSIQGPGMLGGGHLISADQKGNIYVAATNQGMQKLAFKGMAPAGH